MIIFTNQKLWKKVICFSITKKIAGTNQKRIKASNFLLNRKSFAFLHSQKNGTYTRTHVDIYMCMSTYICLQ